MKSILVFVAGLLALVTIGPSAQAQQPNHLPKVVIEVVPPTAQRYPTDGDFYYDDQGTLHVKISKMDGGADLEFSTLIHELVEAYFVARYGVKLDDIDAFDTAYEKNRKPGDESDPGDDARAPYHEAHEIAKVVQRALTPFLNEGKVKPTTVGQAN